MSDAAERTIFVVVDPAQDTPIALDRVLAMSRFDPVKTPEYYRAAKIHLFLAVDCDNTDTSADNPAMHRDSAWLLERVIKPLEESKLDFHVELSWSSDWYGSIIQRAEKLSPELIMVPLVSKPSEAGRLFNESIWRLMRTAKCPVLVVRPAPVPERSTILAALNIQSHKPEYQRLNDLIATRSRWIAAAHGADLHIVNAYEDSLHYPDRSQLAKMTEVDTANIHVVSGDPEDVIADVAKKIGADVVVIGTRNRASRWRGNTAERIINKVDCDILAIN